MNYRLLAGSLLVGIVGNIASASILSFNGQSVPLAIVFLSLALILSIFMGYTIHRLYILWTLGIKGWEASVSAGTSTRDCVQRSQRSIDFLGIASSKWNREGNRLRRMLVRHASNGGKTRFLLLNPYGRTCKSFETIKNVLPGTISKLIVENTLGLLEYARADLPIEVRFYEENPRFRIAVVDANLMMLGIYSYVTDSGEDTPQLILDGAPRTWSFFFAYTGYFEHLWNASESAPDVLAAAGRELSRQPT